MTYTSIKEINTDYCLEAAEVLTDLFEEHSNEEGLLSDEGLKVLYEEFGLVPPELRGKTFEYFVYNLNYCNISHDVSQINASPSIYEGVVVDKELEDNKL